MSHRYKQFVNLLTLCLFCITCSMPIVHADTLTIPNTFTAGTPAQASQVNANFNAISSWSANIANDNIKSGAAISPSKLDLTSAASPTNEWFVKRSSNNRLVSGGVTGDSVPRVSLLTDSSGRGNVGFGAGSASAQDIFVTRLSSGSLGVMSGVSTYGVLTAYQLTCKQSDSLSPIAKLGLVSATGRSGVEFADNSGTIPTDVYIERISAGAIRVRTGASDGELSCGTFTTSGNTTLATSGTLQGNNVVPGFRPGCRLTLTSATPVTGDVTGAGTLYLTPYVSNVMPAYTGSVYVERIQPEISVSLASISSGTNYDVWYQNTAGTGSLSLTAWTNDTTRATALARSTISGLLYKSGDETSLYVGTIRGSGAGVTEDSVARRFVWNMYNRVGRVLIAQDASTASWTYTTATVREWNGVATDGVSRVAFVRGLDDEEITATQRAHTANSTALVARYSGIGLDSSTAFSGQSGTMQPNFTGGQAQATAAYSGNPGIGYHTLRNLEYSNATGTTTWQNASTGLWQSGMVARTTM